MNCDRAAHSPVGQVQSGPVMAQPNPELRDPQQASLMSEGSYTNATDERDAAQAPELATAEVLRMINGSGGPCYAGVRSNLGESHDAL